MRAFLVLLLLFSGLSKGTEILCLNQILPKLSIPHYHSLLKEKQVELDNLLQELSTRGLDTDFKYKRVNRFVVNLVGYTPRIKGELLEYLYTQIPGWTCNPFRTYKDRHYAFEGAASRVVVVRQPDGKVFRGTITEANSTWKPKWEIMTELTPGFYDK